MKKGKAQPMELGLSKTDAGLPSAWVNGLISRPYCNGARRFSQAIPSERRGLECRFALSAYGKAEHLNLNVATHAVQEPERRRWTLRAEQRRALTTRA